MKSKLSWIPFIVLLPLACFLKLGQSLFSGGLFGLSTLQLEYLYLGCVALMFLLALLFCLIDKRIAAYYLPRRNVAAGIFALMTALLLAVDGSGMLIRTFSSGEKNALTIITAIMSILSAIVFIAMGISHIVRRGNEKKLSLIYALPPVMFALRMILSFVSFTTISVRLADVSRLVCYVFTLMFFFYFAVVLSLIKTKNAVKMCLVFGFPAVTVLIPYSIYRLAFNFDSMIMNNVESAVLLFVGLYIFAILVEITRFVTDCDTVLPIFEEDEKEDEDLADKKVQGFLVNTLSEDENDAQEDDTFIEKSDTEGYLYQKPDTDKETDEAELAEGDAHSYLTDVNKDYANGSVEDDRPKDYESKLDDVDRLILEITQKID